MADLVAASGPDGGIVLTNAAGQDWLGYRGWPGTAPT